ncbi:MAG TPA: VanW family protein [Clostridia bacterium]|nr:VanW family protein [Clostridia bacterium]
MSDSVKKGLKAFIAGLAIVVVLFAAGMLLLSNIYTGDTIRKGVHIGQTDVSWMSADNARQLLLEEHAKGGERYITLTYGDKVWTISPEDIGYHYDIENAVQQAYKIGREGNIFKKLYDSLLLASRENQVPVGEGYDSDRLLLVLHKIKKEIDSEPRDAVLSYESGKISITRETNYRNLDIDRNIELIENQLIKGVFGNIALQVDERKPRLTYDGLSAINGVISSFSTRFNRSDLNRTDNIKLASSRINNRIILPGESFSMNETLGPRTQDNGYKEAPIIFKNELVPGTGGGVCQVSSTLYNTVLLAGLDVIERTHHSMPLTYISPGRDATINENSIDFRFVNDSGYPICLKAGVSGNRLIISMLGRKRDDGLVISLKTQTVAVYLPKPDEIILDYTLPNGQAEVERKPVKGLRVILYREAYKNGALEWREKLTEDYYKPIQGKIRVSSDLYRMNKNNINQVSTVDMDI